MNYKIIKNLDEEHLISENKNKIETKRKKLDKSLYNPENLLKNIEIFISLSENIIIRAGLLFLVIYKFIHFILYSVI